MTPLASPDAEQAVLGALLLDAPTALVACNDAGLAAHHFASDWHRGLFRTITGMVSEGRPVDVLLTLDELERTAGTVDGTHRDAVAALTDATPTAANAGHHARIVVEYAHRRAITEAGGALQSLATDRLLTTETLVAQAEAIMARARPTVTTRAVSGADAAKLVQAAYDAARTRGDALLGSRSPVRELDTLLGGFQPGRVYVLAARPGVGKSAFASQCAAIAASDARETGQQVLLFSLEMPAAEVAGRIVAQVGDVCLTRMQRGRLYDDEYPKLARGVSWLQSVPLSLYDDPGLSVQQLSLLARRAHLAAPVRMLVVDYLQLVSAPGENRNNEVAAVSRALKRLAMELHCPVLALSQLSRPPKDGVPRKPRLDDLRDSGAIEQDADCVIFIHRPNAEDDDDGRAEIIVGKQRNGPKGTVMAAFTSRCTAFGDLREAA